MDLGLISVRYARALLKASVEEELSDRVYADMQTLSESYIKVPELRFTIDNPMLSKDSKKELLLAAVGNKASELTQRFISLILKEGRENIIQFIANSYISLYRKQKNLIRAKLLTATTLSADSEKKLRKLVESKTNGTVEFETKVDKDIIGGFILEYDTYRLDASVKSKLNNICQSLSN